ncbi:MAG: ribonuclease toxin immunity protein CdiI [Firmicutes bacterium]|nr:ribonuclease toxin immunity protein CdiI [Bacillota bacterium]
MKNCRLDHNDLLDDSHLPVLMVMNMISEERFLTILKAINGGNGFGEEYGVCTLPNDLDEFDKANGERLDGVEFALYSGEEVVIDFETFYFYLKILCGKYVKDNFEQVDVVDRLLEEFTSKFLRE